MKLPFLFSSGLIGLAGLATASTLDPHSIPKFQDPLPIPGEMPYAGVVPAGGAMARFYQIAVRQFEQQILPHPLPATTVWGYGSAAHPGTFAYPSLTINADAGQPIRVQWINDLRNPLSGEYLPHLFAVDPTLHWANPPGGAAFRDTRPVFATTPEPYTGPVPIVTHVHGAHTYDDSDGYPEAWYLPAATNIPPSFAAFGSLYETFRAQAEARTGHSWAQGSAVFDYPNDQPPSTLWYHDHALGMTRLNVYAGPAGFYLLRGGKDSRVARSLPGPAPFLGDAPGTRYYEVPIAIQDRSFNEDGSLFYPDRRSYFDGVEGPYMPETDVSPYWNPEFFGETMLANGKTWPYLDVEPRRYRLRLLNGCNSRFLILKLSDPNLAFWQIGAEGGYLPRPVERKRLLMAPAERADVIVDFTGMAPGTEIILQNVGPDEPFSGGEPDEDFDLADPDTTGQVMLFRVGELQSVDTSVPPRRLQLPPLRKLPPAKNVRQVALLEMMSMEPGVDAPVAAMLGVMQNGVPMHKMWGDGITENPILGRTEVWEIHNFTADAHPIHLHQVQFEVLNRQGLEQDEEGEVVTPVQPVGGIMPPEPGEAGLKDTVIAYPGQVTRVRARFTLPGLFVWHCHIVEHEDNEMMRPLRVR
ncbi:MAG TPA: multicopper oxidase [Fimbriimonas sp.]